MNHYPKAEMKGVTSSHLELLKFAFGEALLILEGNWVVIAAYTQPKQTTKQPYKMKCRNGGINKELKLTLMLLKGFYRYCRCTCTLWCTKSDGVQLVQFSMCRVWWAGRNDLWCRHTARLKGSAAEIAPQVVWCVKDQCQLISLYKIMLQEHPWTALDSVFDIFAVLSFVCFFLKMWSSIFCRCNLGRL